MFPAAFAGRLRFENDGRERQRERLPEVLGLGQVRQGAVFAPLTVERVATAGALGLKPKLSQPCAQFDQLFGALDQKRFGGEMVFAGDMRCPHARVEVRGQRGQPAGLVLFDQTAEGGVKGLGPGGFPNEDGWKRAHPSQMMKKIAAIHNSICGVMA